MLLYHILDASFFNKLSVEIYIWAFSFIFPMNMKDCRNGGTKSP